MNKKRKEIVEAIIALAIVEVLIYFVMLLGISQLPR